MRIGITGSIGSGKSEVSKYLKSKGYLVIDADKINAQLLERQNIVDDIEKILNIHFKDGQVDKNVLASIIFTNDEKRLKLNHYLHPLIKKEIIKQTEHYSICFVEVPLLYEAGFEDIFDKVILVYAPLSKIYQNLKIRKMTKTEADARLKYQIDNDLKKDLADIVVDNSLDLNNLYCKVDTILKSLLKL